ncbi:alpha/beta hydrolase [Carboxylicivirga sp. N1Y90]|uniref:alpha/beta hydrolase n=1 Tax=Carboxylicivirga fragile TaxID=3417571 RepID=UPI003D33AA6B|nr:alpha/beta hydrolase [Marinilabiliaceae bacterium N1Y90]
MHRLIRAVILILAIGKCTLSFSNNKSESKSCKDETPVVQAEQTFEVNVEHDIVYAKGLSHSSINSSDATVMPLKLDVYTPDNELENRPVFLFIHGGGFAGGTKQQGRIIEWANYYTSRGWVFISADYRLKRHKGTVPIEWLDFAEKLPKAAKVGPFLAIYPAIRDAKAALRWVVANADVYNINTDYITVGGGSAGAITAITMGISNPEDFRDELTFEQDPSLTTTNIDQSYQIKIIVDLWGSKAALDAMEKIFSHQRFDRNDPALFIAHGTEDPTVPFINAKELKQMYESTGAPFVYYPLEGKGHGAWGAMLDNKRLEELAFDFIVEQQKLKVIRDN